jgi:hypothetical protein
MEISNSTNLIEMGFDIRWLENIACIIPSQFHTKFFYAIKKCSHLEGGIDGNIIVSPQDAVAATHSGTAAESKRFQRSNRPKVAK